MKSFFYCRLRFFLICFVLISAYHTSLSKGDSHFSSGKKFLQLPDYHQAYACFLKAYSESKSSGDVSAEINSLLELGKLSTLFSWNDSASCFLNKGITLAQKQRPMDNGLIGFFEQALGRVSRDVGDIETAGEHFRKAIALLEKTFGINDIRTALAYCDYSSYFTFKQQQDSAVTWSTKAYFILRKLNNKNPEVACAILFQYATAKKESIGPNIIEMDRIFPAIRKLYQEALSLARSNYMNASAEEGKALQNLANTHTDCIRPFFRENRPNAERNWQLADSLYQEAIRVREAALGKWNVSVATSRYTHALIYYYHPALSKRIQSLVKLNASLKVLDTTFSPFNGLSYPGTNGTAFPYILSVQMTFKCEVLRYLYTQTNDRRYLEALHQHNKIRLALWNRILSNFSTKDIGQVISIWNFTPFEEAIESAYDLHQLTKDPWYIGEIFEFAEQGKNNDYTQLLIKKGLMKPGKDNPRPFSISIDSLGRILETRTAFITYIQSPNKDIRDSYALVVTRKKTSIVKLAKRALTDSLQKVFIRSMEAGDAKLYDEMASQLFGLLLKPVLDSVGSGIEQLIVSPSGTYSEIPFDALTIRKSKARDFRSLDYVLNHYTISYALNAGIAFGRKDSTQKKGLTVFLPKSDTLPDLLFSRKQAEELKARYAGDFFFGEQAVLNRFAERSKNRSVVQVSTHSISSKESYSDGLLLMQDGVVELDDLYGKHIPVDLFIISACASGTGRQEYGEGTKSFARSFIYAGAGGTISTLWCVDEKATAGLLQSFYHHLSDGSDVVHSLEGAKKDYLKNCEIPELANPFYWGGLVFTGNPNLNVEISEKTNLLHYLFFIVFLGLLLFFTKAIRRNFIR